MKKCVHRLLLLLCGVYVVCQPVLAAEFSATLEDAQGMPIANGVVVLMPTEPVDFTKLPTAVMDQRDNMFVPFVLAIRTNTQVRFPNSDDVRHHVYSFSPAKKFELRLYHGMTAEPVVFDKPGTVVLGCNIHDSMVAYIYVVDSNFFAVSDSAGNAVINAPAGNYQLQVYHPQLSNDQPASPLQLMADTTQIIRLENLIPSKKATSDDALSTLF